ncbi:MAG: hypothetical protein KKB79_03380 [Nanoarchaeota archaeon]|nr:hypothetical protein [Nanoarchaeota archaeon]
MEKESERIKIERSYGTPERTCWGYEARATSNNSVILEGEVELKGNLYCMSLMSTDGGREELEGVDDPDYADSLLIEMLQARALELLGSSFR